MLLYFIPIDPATGARPDLRERSTLRKLRIDHAIEPKQFDGPREILAGPDGGRGLLLTPKRPGCVSDDQRLRVDLAGQTWRQIDDSVAWVGRWNDQAVDPIQLQRPAMVAGVAVDLADGSTWIAAHARKWIEYDQQLLPLCPLPKTLSLQGGKWQPGQVARRFLQLATLAEQNRQAEIDAIAAAPTGASEVRFTFDAIDDLAIATLQANYRIGPAELDLLQLYDIQSRTRLVAAAMDSATLAAWSQKKTELARAGFDS